MAYAATVNTNRKIGTFTAVALIHAGVGYMLVTGLAAQFVRVIDPRIDTYDIPPVPKPTPTPEVKPPVDQQPEFTQPRPTPANPFDFGPGPLPTLPAEDKGALGDAIFPTPTPTAEATRTPLFTPKGARTKGNPGLWVTTNDYPSGALRAEQEGVVRVRLSVSADGRPTGCDIIASSGFDLLDSATCDKLMRRAKFEAATDETGAKVAGSYTTSVRWQIPE